MKNIDGLRKECRNLSGFERASMTAEAIAQGNEALVDCLYAPSLRGAFTTLTIEIAAAWIAMIAVNGSRKAESACWRARFIVSTLQNNTEFDEAKARKMRTLEEEAERSHRAWLFALRAFDAEIGTTCLSLAGIIDAGLCENIFRNGGAAPDFAPELRVLRKAWNSFAQHCAAAPMAQVTDDAEDDD